MTSDNIETKTIEELANSLTLEQVKEQMALYHRLYHKLRKEQDPEYIKRKNEKERERYWKNKAKDEPKKYNKKYNATEYMILKAQLKIQSEILILLIFPFISFDFSLVGSSASSGTSTPYIFYCFL